MTERNELPNGGRSWMEGRVGGWEYWREERREERREGRRREDREEREERKVE